MHHHKLVIAFDAILVMGPEHARVFSEGGWDRDRILSELLSRVKTPMSELARGAGDIAEGLPAVASAADTPLPKFMAGGLMLAYAGGGAGLFSMLIAGWVNGTIGSKPVTRKVQN